MYGLNYFITMILNCFLIELLLNITQIMYQLTVNKTNSQFNIADLCCIIYRLILLHFLLCEKFEK